MFSEFSHAVHRRWEEMSKGELFVTKADDLWTEYIASYPAGTNPTFRTRTTYDCQCCKQFVSRIGKVVGIQSGKMVSVWDDLDVPEPFKTVAERLSQIVHSSSIRSVFRTKEKRYGLDHNYDGKTGERYDHFFGEIAKKHYSAEPDTKRGEQDDIYKVMRRGLQELQYSDLETVLDLISSNGLYRGEEHKDAVRGFMQLQHDFAAAGGRDTFIWENLGHRYARFRNTVIGTLLVDLAEGKDLDQSVRSFESKVAPMNYKRPTAIITQKMVENAVETLTTLGLHGAISRRYARLSEVSVNDVLFVDNEAKGQMKDGVSKILESSVKKMAPDVKAATRIDSDTFVRSILPGARTLEILLQNRHTGNFLSLTGSDDPTGLFKWSNPFAWSYDGDVTDSVKQRVKAAGGNINAKLRVSLSWYNFDDLDLHATTPKGDHIYYASKQGVLDVDMNAGHGATRTPVENLAFNTLHDGVYTIYVHQFHHRETIDYGFAIEVESAGVLNQYSYDRAIPNRGTVSCFKLHVKKGELVKIETDLKGGTSSQEKWGVKTETLVPVSAVLNSPNYWNGEGIGARHLIFALRGCRNPGSTRGIYNEFLRSDLDKHRKVFEVLGAKTKCAPSDDQVSGVGFTSARGDSVTVVVDGRRSYNVEF